MPDGDVCHSQDMDRPKKKKYAKECWISLAEAQERSVGNEKWWTKEAGVTTMDIDVSEVLTAIQKMEGIEPALPIPVDSSPGDSDEEKPVWVYDDGNMYLGFWKICDRTTDKIRHGKGIYYGHEPVSMMGSVYVSTWKDDKPVGKVEFFWLESSNVWKNNTDDSSEIANTNGRGRRNANENIRRLPFKAYATMNENFQICDEDAIITLKDGTRRRGPWQNDYPQGRGGWHTHKKVYGKDLVKLVRNKKRKSRDNHVVEAKKKGRWYKRHSPEIKEYLHAWVAKHGANTMPTKQEREEIMDDTGLNETQVKSFFYNNRRRSCWGPQEQEEEQEEQAEEEEEEGSGNNDEDDEDYVDTNVGEERKKGGYKRHPPRAIKYLKTWVASVADPLSALKKDREKIIADTGLEEEQIKKWYYWYRSKHQESGVNEHDEHKGRIKKICNWISKEVIGHDPTQSIIHSYAATLYENGFNSVDLIKKHLEEHDINEVGMSKLHKRIFLQKLHEGW